MRRLPLVLALAAVGAAAYVLVGRTLRSEDGPRFLTAPVDRGPIHAAVTATGTVNPVVTVQVGTYVSGPIQALFADFNTPVQRGQLLAKIDPRPFQVKVDGAAAELLNARAQVEKSRADAALKAVTLRRTRALRTQGIVAESELDLAVSQQRQAQAQVALDEAQVQSAAAKLAEAQVNLAYTDIVSPVDGVVVSRTIDVGQTVAATFQTPTLFLVAEDLSRMQVLASVSESDIGGVAAGQEVTFSVDAYPTTTFQGRVAQVRSAPVTVQNVVTYDVVVAVDNHDLQLKPGMTANVTVTTATRDDVLRVRTSALRFRPPAVVGDVAGAAAAADRRDGRRVFVLDRDGVPQPVAISSGLADDSFTEVVGGLQEGDPVVVGIRRDEPAGPSGQARPPTFAPARRGPH